MKKYIFISLATTITLATLIGCSTTIKNKAILKQVDLQGHRGARALRPENSIPAFISCIENNMTTIELDTAVTKDKKLIIIHDTVLNEKLCVDSTGKPAKAIPVANLTVAELKKYDCGSLQHEDFPEQVTVKNTRLITLEEFFNFIKEYERKSNAAGTIKFNIEIKFKESAAIAEVKEAAQIMVRSLQQSGMRERTVVQCFNLDLIKEIRKINPGLTTSALFTLTRVEGLLLLAGFDSKRDEIIKKTIALKSEIISPHYIYVTPEFIKKCHDNNIAVIPWTVNKKEKMVELLRMGVDGIISDNPVRLYKVYSEWKKMK